MTPALLLYVQITNISTPNLDLLEKLFLFSFVLPWPLKVRRLGIREKKARGERYIVSHPPREPLRRKGLRKYNTTLTHGPRCNGHMDITSLYRRRFRQSWVPISQICHSRHYTYRVTHGLIITISQKNLHSKAQLYLPVWASTMTTLWPLLWSEWSFPFTMMKAKPHPPTDSPGSLQPSLRI